MTHHSHAASGVNMVGAYLTMTFSGGVQNDVAMKKKQRGYARGGITIKEAMSGVRNMRQVSVRAEITCLKRLHSVCQWQTGVPRRALFA